MSLMSAVRCIRRWCWRHVRRHDGEICDTCGRAYWSSLGESYWLTQDALWTRVVGSSGTRCPACFTREARRQGIDVYWQAVLDG